MAVGVLYILKIFTIIFSHNAHFVEHLQGCEREKTEKLTGGGFGRVSAGYQDQWVLILQVSGGATP